jgi:hypothetical protein
VTSWPATWTVPLSARSRPPTMLSRVVLPDPDRPRRAISFPAGMVKVMPRRAWAAVRPDP